MRQNRGHLQIRPNTDRLFQSALSQRISLDPEVPRERESPIVVEQDKQVRVQVATVHDQMQASPGQ